VPRSRWVFPALFEPISTENRPGIFASSVVPAVARNPCTRNLLRCIVFSSRWEMCRADETEAGRELPWAFVDRHPRLLTNQKLLPDRCA